MQVVSVGVDVGVNVAVGVGVVVAVGVDVTVGVGLLKSAMIFLSVSMTTLSGFTLPVASPSHC